ncbi:transposase [Meiothermus granaticius]|uniref:transposase n=1 Tax=Meiothermus granaticius TaxID=863370 RepID=UPI0011C3C74C|nr:transposase [Meiothermus granaticius]
MDYQHWERWKTVEPTPQESPQASASPVEGPTTYLYTTIVHCPKLKTKLRVIAILTHQPNKPPRHQLFFSTDLTQDPRHILQVYAARFQMEFLFRDTKQHLGLEDCHSRHNNSTLIKEPPIRLLSVSKMPSVASTTNSSPAEYYPSCPKSLPAINTTSAFRNS